MTSRLLACFHVFSRPIVYMVHVYKLTRLHDCIVHFAFYMFTFFMITWVFAVVIFLQVSFLTYSRGAKQA